MEHRPIEFHYLLGREASLQFSHQKGNAFIKFHTNIQTIHSFKALYQSDIEDKMSQAKSILPAGSIIRPRH